MRWTWALHQRQAPVGVGPDLRHLSGRLAGGQGTGRQGAVGWALGEPVGHPVRHTGGHGEGRGGLRRGAPRRRAGKKAFTDGPHFELVR